MTFNEKQLAFFKAHNIEATDENYAKLMEAYKANKTNKLADSELGSVSGGVSDDGYKGATDYDFNFDYGDVAFDDIFPALADQ